MPLTTAPPPDDQRYADVPDVDFTAHAQASGWTDGLPVVAPTPDLVAAMLGDRVDPAGSLGPVAPRMGELTLERLAANAVLAGCRPEHFPVLVAAFEALLDDSFNLSAVQVTTNPVGPMLLVNGPAAIGAGVESGSGCLGPGPVANAVIGRAVRLTLINVGGALPGTVDRATQGSPLKYSFCVAENEAESPWDPWHVRAGFGPEDGVVTVAQACGFVNVLDMASDDGHELIETMAASMLIAGSNNYLNGRGPVWLLVGPKHAHILARAGYDVPKAQERLFELSALPATTIPPALRRFVCGRREIDLGDDTVIPCVAEPGDIRIAVVGGAGNHSVFVPTFGDGASVSRVVRARPDDEGNGHG